MKKRFGLIWRVAVALIVAMSLAPIFVINGATADYEPTRPETYMDPFPAYMDATLIDTLPWLTGTSIWGAEGRDVVEVDVQIQRNSDGYYWDDNANAGVGGWMFENTWNALITGTGGPWGTITPDWISDQWAWAYDLTNLDSTFMDSGVSYTVRVRAQDNQDFEDLTPAVATFCYDDDDPDVSFTTPLPATINSLTEIKGTAHDDPVVASCPGTIDHTRVEIQNVDTGLYWNGHFWQADGVWIKTQGTNSWSISTSTNPPLPQWQHDNTYRVRARTVDKANNDNTEGWITFDYLKQLTTSSCYLDPLPDYANAATDFIANGFTGTSKADGGHLIAFVFVRIVDTTTGFNNIWWNDFGGFWDTTFSTTTDWPFCVPAVITLGAYGQYDWVAVPTGIIWTEGHTYQITAWAQDDTGPTPRTYTSTMDSFKYDLSAPNSNIAAFAVQVRNTWNSLTGGSGDTNGQIGNVVVLIQRDPLGTADYWNGAGWGTVEWGGGGHWWDWIFATGGSGSASVTWSVTKTTNPGLPPLVNDMDYHIEVIAFDKAGNVETTAQKDFTFVIDMEVGEGYTPPTTVPTTPPGPTSTGVPTTPGGGGGGATAVPTYTYVPPPTATYTYVPPVATATPTATAPPGFSGSGTIGPAGGTVTASDNEGKPRVTATFGANALSTTADVSISGSGTCTGTAPEGYIFGNSCFDITPSQALGAKVKICVHYTEADLLAGGDEPENLRLAYKDAEGNWKVLKTTVEGGTICAETDHLSSWAVVGKTGVEGWEWWHWTLIGIGGALVLLILVYLILRIMGSRGEGGEGEDFGDEGGYEEGEV